MKKTLLLLLALLATVGMTWAQTQDIYYAGYRTNSSGFEEAVFGKNGSYLISFPGSATSEYEGKDVIVSGGKVYYGFNNVVQDNNRGWVYNATDQSYFLNLGENTYVHSFAMLPGTSTIYTYGTKKIDGYWTAVIWSGSNTTPKRLGAEGVSSYVFGSGAGRYQGAGWTFGAGIQYNSSGNKYNGKVWKYTTELFDLGESMNLRDVAVYNNEIWTVGVDCTNSSKRIVKVWKGSSVQWTLTNQDSYAQEIWIEAGDVYVSGWEGGSIKVWKNGTVLYTINPGSGKFNSTSVVANSNGVYSSGHIQGNKGVIWKNDTQLYANTGCEHVQKIYIPEPTCTNTDALALPFFEGFENANTKWACWTKVDKDNNNVGNVSYFDRCGKRVASAATGDYCAWHRYDPNNDQEGWLISPKLFLQPGRTSTQLTFKSREGLPSYFSYEGVWISTTNTNTSSFTEVWHQTAASDSWKTVTIDLKAYQGESVYIAFKYTGNNAHNWYIDDVNVTESWSPSCANVTSYPYEDHFASGLNECWYIIDKDLSGGKKCWQYDTSTGAVYHPYGQSGVKQEGWLISKGLQLETGKNYTLTFNSKVVSSGSDKKNSVWVAVNKTGTPNTSDYTKIWEETDYTTNVWGQRTIDLTAYAGKKINIAFKYEGTYAHHWYVDDFKVTATIPQYTITVLSSDLSQGTVTGGGTYNQNQSVTLKATPKTGFEFKKWTKDGIQVSTNPDYTITVTQDATYIGVFGEPEVIYYTVQTAANPTEGGTVTGGQTVAAGSTVTLTATPNEGYEFIKWNDNSTDNPYEVTVNSDITYTANFALKSFNVTLTAEPAEGGTVSGGGMHNYGETVELTATPNEGYEFTTWDDGVLENPRLITVTKDEAYVAFFVDTTTVTHTINVVSNDITLGEVTGGGTYPEGSTVTLTATPIGTNVFEKWDDGNTDNPRTITVTKDETYTAIFKTQKLYTITVESMDTNMGSVIGGGQFPVNTETTIQAIPNGGFFFDSWDDGNKENPRTVVVLSDKTYKAKFSANQVQTYSLYVTCDPAQGYTNPSGTNSYAEGTTVSISATAYDGYEFEKWSDGDKHNPRTITMTENAVYVAYFKKVNQVVYHTITVTSLDDTMGEVSGGGSFEEGTYAIIKATAKEGYVFEKWHDGNTDNPRIITVTADATFIAIFKQAAVGVTHTITVVPNDPAMGVVTGSGTYDEGKQVTITATPKEGYIFEKWSDGDTSNPRIITVSADATYTAIFAKATVYYTVTVTVEPEDGGSVLIQKSNGTLVTNGSTVEENTILNITAIPNEEFVFVGWNDEVTDISRTVEVTADVNLVAKFSGTGVNEFGENALSLYPNPAKDVVRILGLENETAVHVYNSLGALVKVASVNAGGELNVSELAAGLYTVQCGQQTLRFVKE